MKPDYQKEIQQIRAELRVWGALPDEEVDMQAVHKLQKRMSVLLALASGATPTQAEMYAQMSMALMLVTGMDGRKKAATNEPVMPGDIRNASGLAASTCQS